MWASVILAVLCTMLLVTAAPLYAQLGEGGHSSGHDHHGASVGGWEGSAQGVAYSEFNHHLAGLFLLLMGCAELSQSLRQLSLLWARFLLPAAMLFDSVILLVGSGDEVWPGSLSFAQTLSGHDPEIVQHKIYGLLLFLTGMMAATGGSFKLLSGWFRSPLHMLSSA